MGLAIRPCEPDPFLLPSQLGRTVRAFAQKGYAMMHVYGFTLGKKINCQTDLGNQVKILTQYSEKVYMTGYIEGYMPFETVLERIKCTERL